MAREWSWCLKAVTLLVLAGCSKAPQSVSSSVAPVPEPPVVQPGVEDTAKEIAYTRRTTGRYCESRFMRAHDMFLSADSPEAIPADQAAFLHDDDEVLGFVLGDEARAYSVRMLCYHHVVNDQIGDTPLAVTY